MKKAALNILLFALIALPALFAVDFIINQGLRTINFTNGCLNDIYNSKVKADLVVIGGSRAKFQYDPAIIDSVLQTNSFNLGVSGWPFHLQNAIFQIYMQHNKKPKYIIQNIDAFTLTWRPDFFEYEQFIPYANDSIVQKFTHMLDGHFTIMERWFPLFIYNNHFDLMTKGFSSYFTCCRQNLNPTYKGYIPHLENWDGTFDQFKKDNPGGVRFSYSDTTLLEFKKYLEYCAQNDIKIIFVYAPTYFEEIKMINNISDIYNIYKNLSIKYQIPILDYTNDSISYNSKYFMNSQHMNKSGSELFTKKLANDLKSIIH